MHNTHILNPITRALWRAGLLASVLASPQLFAAETDNSQQSESAAPSTALKTVTVTAQRREQSVQDISNAVSAVSSEDLQKTPTDYVGKALTFIPNAHAKSPDGDDRPRWYIRGVGTGDVGASTVFPVGIYADDVYLNAPLAGADPLFDLERIEVLRGPQGTLYGKNTTGGAVNIISKKPTFETDGYGTIGYGSKNQKIISGAIGGALVDERLAARVSVYSKERDGFTENRTTGNDHDAIDRKAIRAQFLAKLNPDLEALWSVHSSKSSGNANGLLPVGSFFGAYQRANPNGRYIEANVENKSRVQHDGTSLTLNYDLGDYRLTSITAFDQTKQRAISDADLTPVELFGRDYNNNQWKQYSQELRLASPTSETLRWIAGAHAFYEKLDSKSSSAVVDDGPGNASFTGIDYKHKNTSYALFGNLAYDFTDAFTLTGGLRWTREEKDIDLNLQQFSGDGFSGAWWDFGSLQNPTAIVNTDGTTANGTLDRNKTWSAVTYDLTPEYRINDNLRVYARYAKGFRSGAFNTGLSSSLEQLSTVNPEELQTYEVGLKSEWLDGRLIANANIFYYNYDDMQVSATTTTATGGIVSLLANDAEGKAKGAELEIQARPIDDLLIQFSAAYLDTEFTSDLWKGNSFVRSPKHTYALGFDYRLPLNIPGKLNLGGDVRYQSREYFISAFQRSEWDNLYQDGYALANAHLTYTTADDKYSITGYVNNITDKQYQVHGISLNRGNAPYWVAYGEPRTAGVSLTAKF